MNKFTILISLIFYFPLFTFSQYSDLEKAQKKVIVEANDKHVLQGYLNLARVQLSSSKIDSAIYNYNLILDKTKFSTSKQELLFRSEAFMFLGAVFKDHHLGHEEAFSYFRNAIEVSQKVKFTKVYVRSTVALIDDMFARKEYDGIPDLLDDSYKFLNENDAESFTYRTLDKAKANYLAIQASSKEERKEAMEFLLIEYSKTERDIHPKQRVFIFIDIVKHFLSDMPKKQLTEMAEENFNVGKDILNGSAKGGLYEAYAKVLIKNHKYHQAIPLLKVAKKYLVGVPHIENYMAVCEDLMLSYEATGQLKMIIPEFNDYKTFQDSFVAIVYSDQILDLEQKYKTEKRESENIQLMAQNDVIQTRFRFSTITGILLLLLLIAGVFLLQKVKKNKRELEKMNEEKNKLFAILAHDLRNPISSLSNLGGKVKFLTKHNRLGDLDELTENTDSKLSALNDNLDNILLWAITESNLVAINPVQVSLLEEIEKINQIYADAIDQKKIIIKNNISDSVHVNTDVTVLQTILRNLINNALKFSLEGGVIEFSLTEEKGGKELRIIDTGIGLIQTKNKEESATNISIRNKAEGTGIGLKICKELAVKSNLDLNLVSNPEGGTIGIIRFKQAV